MAVPTREGVVRSPPLIRALRWILFALLLASAVLTLAGLPELQREVASGRWPRAALALPPTLLGLFVVGYGAYRVVLVRLGRYPAGKLFVQLGVMLLVLGVVAGLALERVRPPAAEPVDLGRALASPDATVRAMAAELLRYRPRDVGLSEAPRLVELLRDPSPEVRRQAHETLVALAGSDLGGADASGADRWRARFAPRSDGR